MFSIRKFFTKHILSFIPYETGDKKVISKWKLFFKIQEFTEEFKNANFNYNSKVYRVLYKKCEKSLKGILI